jgi:hypothetical protein
MKGSDRCIQIQNDPGCFGEFAGSSLMQQFCEHSGLMLVCLICSIEALIP